MNPKAQAAFEEVQERDAPWNRIVRLENRVAELERALQDMCVEVETVISLLRDGRKPSLFHLINAVTAGYNLLTPPAQKRKEKKK